MAYLVRKVVVTKWDPKPGFADHEISADAITADLRTNCNKLSFWKCESTAERELHKVILALMATAKEADRIDVVWVASKDFNEDGIVLEASDGDTPVASLQKLHIDAVLLDYSRLGKVAYRIVDSIRKRQQHYSLPKKEVVQVLREAVDQGLVSIEALSEKMRLQIQKLLESTSGHKKITSSN